jgi:hypothetical protein
MSYMIWVENARRRGLAVLPGPPSGGLAPTDVDARISQLHERLRAMPGATIGRNVAVYSTPTSAPNASRAPRAVPVEVGVECVLPPGGVNGIETSATPEGLVATTEHVGPLETLPNATPRCAPGVDRTDGRFPARAGWCSAGGRVIPASGGLPSIIWCASRSLPNAATLVRGTSG